MNKLPISFCIFVRDEELNIGPAIESVLPIVSEVVVVDTGSIDRTLAIAREYTNRVYKIPFNNDFGNLRTMTAHLALSKWVLMIDADERIMSQDWHIFEKLINQPETTKESNYELDEAGNVVTDSWALPRMRWADKSMTEQIEKDVYPDWQVRLFKNHPNKRISFRRRVHETITGCVRTEKSIAGPIIHHFQGTGKDLARKEQRKLLYTQLREADIAEGIEHDTPAVSEVDK